MGQQERLDGRPVSALPVAYETATGNRIYNLPRDHAMHGGDWYPRAALTKGRKGAS